MFSWVKQKFEVCDDVCHQVAVETSERRKGGIWDKIMNLHDADDTAVHMYPKEWAAPYGLLAGLNSHV